MTSLDPTTGPPSDSRPSVYLEDPDLVVYRASSLGHCLRELWAARSDFEPRPIPQTIQDAMDEGSRLESHILELVGKEIALKSQRQLSVSIDCGPANGRKVIVRGSVDEVAVPGIPVDVKAFSQSLVDDYRAHGLAGFPRYAWQQSVYAHGYGSDQFLMPIYNKDTGRLEPWSLKPLTPLFTIDQIVARVLLIEGLYLSNHMPDDCPGTYGCRYPYLHDDDGKKSEFFPDNLSSLIRARIRLSERVTTFDNARKTLDGAISAKLDSNTRYIFEDRDVQVLPNSNRFNSNAAKAFLTESGVDWEEDPTYWIPGKGSYLRVTKSKKTG